MKSISLDDPQLFPVINTAQLPIIVLVQQNEEKNLQIFKKQIRH